MSVEIFVQRLLIWFKKNKRDYLPWRKTRDPYKILVAEIMLQKTTSKQVAKLFERFVEKYPSPACLANATVTDIEAEIRPLGMEHKRAKRLKKLAQIIVEKYAGEVPRNKAALVSLPGVGDYIANAVLCLAYDANVPLLDTNVIRVLQRALGVTSTKARARTDKALWKKYQQIIPKGKARDFNLAVLDFAAIICTAKNPNHDVCPVADICRFLQKEGKTK
jgi:A/G-specific adenine glycosylase